MSAGGEAEHRLIWRSAIIAAYFALAILIVALYGGLGLAILLFFYLVAGAWLAFVLVWGPFARNAGRAHSERMRLAGRPPFQRGQ
jgi:hypothetical protein